MSNVVYLHPEQQPKPAEPTLADRDQRDIDQAELFLYSLEAETSSADGPRAAYLLGLAEGHLANLLEILRMLRGTQ